MNQPVIDASVPVSREDYDRMADQRDRFRDTLTAVKAEFASLQDAIEGVKSTVREVDSCDRGDSWLDVCFEIGRLDEALRRARLEATR